VRTIRDSVILAGDTAAALSDRHEAFGDLVIRFQDMAFAYAFAVLRDAYLAEDVAQEAFITAWHKLPQLREPEAFPGWFKRIVATQCNRLLRTKRLQFVAPELAIDTGTHGLGLDHSTERRQLVQKVLKAITELPDKQRVVTMLFYVNGYTQDDISRFLDLPTSTVNKRLYTAREALKERMVEVVKDDLEQHRPSRNRDFSNEVNARLRPIAKNDWSTITRLAFGSSRDALGKELWLSRRQNFAESRYIRHQYVAEERRRIVGYGAIEQSVYLPRYNLFIVASPSKLRQGVGDLLLDQLFQDLEKAKAITVSVRERSSNTDLIDLLTKRGFAEVNRQLDSRLMIAEADTNGLTAGKAVTKKKNGISISTLREERATDPRCVEKLYELSVLLAEEKDGLNFKPPAYNEREARMWLEMPYVLPDGYFIAKHDDRYVGVLDVNRHDSLPRGVSLSGPGVLPAYRRRGIGTDLMLRAVEFSKTNNYDVIRIFNRPTDQSLLRLLRKIGFKTELEIVTLEKCVRNVVEVNPDLYDEYAGTYIAQRPKSELKFEVRREIDRLTLECVGQKVELFPTSDTDFFIKMFYGEVKFIRGRGRVNSFDVAMQSGKSTEEYRAIKSTAKPERTPQ